MIGARPGVYTGLGTIIAPHRWRLGQGPRYSNMTSRLPAVRLGDVGFDPARGSVATGALLLTLALGLGALHLVERSPITDSLHGGHGGEYASAACGPGDELVALRVTRDSASRLITSARPRCRSTDGLPATPVGVGAPAGDATDLRCPRGYEPVGMHGRSGAMLDAVGLVCTRSERTHKTRAVGALRGGTTFELRCPADQRLIGLEARAWDYLHAVQLVCSDGHA